MDNWAVVIGVDHYEVPEARLKGAVDDALAMREWLLGPGEVPERQLILLLSPAPGRNLGGVKALPATRANVIQAIDRVLKRSGEVGDRFYFHFSGHGLSSRINATNQSGMAFADFTELLTDNSLTVASLFDRFQATSFKEQYYFIDGCRNAPFGTNRLRGSYPETKEPQPPISPQYGMYATAPMLKAMEADERGAFTKALLDGLAGAGKAKRWDPDEGEDGAYIVRWSTLFAYVAKTVGNRALTVAEGLIQTPRRFGEDDGKDPILARHPASAFANGERLTVTLAPDDALTDSSVVVRDLTGLVKSQPKPITALPICFDLPPRSYGVDVEAHGWRRIGRVRTIDLYEPSTIDLKLEAAPPPPTPKIPDVTRSFHFAGIDQFFQILPEPKAQESRTALVAASQDALATLEIADHAGHVLEAGRGVVTRDPIAPGFYRVRLVSPEGQVTEQLADVEAGETVRIEIPAPPPTGPVLQRLITARGFTSEPDGTISVSESVGPSASLHLSTVLALGSAAALESGNPYGQRLRALGLATPLATSGIHLVVGSEDETDWLGGLSASLTAAPTPRPLQRSATEPAIGSIGFEHGAGPCILRLHDRAQGGSTLALPLVVLPGRATLAVLTRDRTGTLSMHVYMPALSGPQAEGGPWRDIEFPLSSFASLRRIELMQRAAAHGRITLTLPEIRLLLQDKWLDPVAGCLGGYLSLRRGETQYLDQAASNLVRYFDGLPDAHVIRGALLERTGRDGAADLYYAALARGLPLFRDGVMMLTDAATRLKLQHQALPGLQAWAGRTPADPLWSATIEMMPVI